MGVELITALGSVATAVGVFLAWIQLLAAKEQARSQFEDRLVEQFREIIAQLPVEALLGESLSDDLQRTMLGVFYRYVDLCNEEAFLHRTKRIRDETWNEWLQGIKSLMLLPAFRAAWLEIQSRAPDSFTDFKALDISDDGSPHEGDEMKKLGPETVTEIGSGLFSRFGIPLNDQSLYFDFFVVFSRFEYALKRADWIHNHAEKLEVNWDLAAKEIEEECPALASTLRNEHRYMFDSPPEKQTINGFVCSKVKDDTDLRALLRSISTVRNNLFHGGKWGGTDHSRNRELISCALEITQKIVRADRRLNEPFHDG